MSSNQREFSNLQPLFKHQYLLFGSWKTIAIAQLGAKAMIFFKKGLFLQITPGFNYFANSTC